MADNDVKIKVSLDGADKVQKGLTGIGSNAGEADSKLGRMASGGLKGAGVALLGFATAAVTAGGALTAGVLSQYSQYEQNIGGIETMFKSSAGKMEQYAANAYKTAGLSANEYMSQATSFSAALLQGLGGDTDKAAEVANRAITDMSDNAAKFGSDIGMIQNAYQGFAKQNFTMLDNLKLGYGGTASEMARLVNDSGVMGDSFTATAENINSVSYDKIIAAIGKVQDKMGVTGTTAREAAQTISGSVDMLKGSFANLLTGLGSADQDVAVLAGNVITSLETVLNNVTPIIDNIGTNITRLGPQLGTMMVGLVGAVSSAIPVILQAGVALIGGLITGVSQALPGLIPAVLPAIVNLVTMVSTLVPLLLDAGLKAVIALANGLLMAAPEIFAAATQLVTGVVSTFLANLPTMITMAVGLVVAIAQGLITALPAILDAALQLVMGLAAGLLQAIPMLVAALPPLIMGIISFLVAAIPQIITTGVSLLTSLITALPDIITTIVAALPQIITAVIGAVVGAIPLLIDAGIKLLTALVTALPQIITAVVAAIPLIISSVLKAVIGSIPQIINGGIKLFIALIGALPQIINTVVGAIPQIIHGVLGALTGAIPQLIMAGVKLLVALVSNMPAILGGIIGAIPQIIGGIVSAIVGSIPQIVSAGFQLISGLWTGIANAKDWLLGQIGGFVGDVVGGIKDFFGIHSPSRRLRDEVGDELPAGIGVGIKRSEDEALKPLQELNVKMLRTVDDIPPLKINQLVTSDIPSEMAIAQKLKTSVPMSFTSTQNVDVGQSITAAISKAFENLRIEPAVTAHIATADMNTMATRVQSALINVRSADTRSAALAARQGVR